MNEATKGHGNPMGQCVLRRATMDDFDDIYSIWMQDHVIPFMTFERLPKEQFKLIFDALMTHSEVFVIEDEGHVVATRRIIPSGGEHAHSVELASFGVDKDHLGKGYGKRFYDYLIEKIKEEKPNIKRVEIGQETDNEIAFNLATKMGFKAEVTLPDWIRRKTGPEKFTNKWNMAARFMGLLLDPTLVEKSIANVNIFSPKIPDATVDQRFINDIRIEKNNDTKSAICYYNDKKLGVCHFAQGVRRFGHIQFWEIKLEPDCDLQAMGTCLRKLACDASAQCKKIEIYVADNRLSELVETIGFHCRGKKIGSCKIGDEYYDEIGVDLSFFNIQDAKELLDIYISDVYQLGRVKSVLSECYKVIHNELTELKIDQYTALYLENMAFQMIREGLGEQAIQRYGQKDQLPQPWQSLIQELSGSLKEKFFQLDMLTTKSSANNSTPALAVRNKPY